MKHKKKEKNKEQNKRNIKQGNKIIKDQKKEYESK